MSDSIVPEINSIRFSSYKTPLSIRKGCLAKYPLLIHLLPPNCAIVPFSVDVISLPWLSSKLDKLSLLTVKIIISLEFILVDPLDDGRSLPPSTKLIVLGVPLIWSNSATVGISVIFPWYTQLPFILLATSPFLALLIFSFWYWSTYELPDIDSTSWVNTYIVLLGDTGLINAFPRAIFLVLPTCLSIKLFKNSVGSDQVNITLTILPHGFPRSLGVIEISTFGGPSIIVVPTGVNEDLPLIYCLSFDIENLVEGWAIDGVLVPVSGGSGSGASASWTFIDTVVSACKFASFTALKDIATGPKAVDAVGENVNTRIVGPGSVIHDGELPWMLYDNSTKVWLVPESDINCVKFIEPVSPRLTFCVGIFLHTGAVSDDGTSCTLTETVLSAWSPSELVARTEITTEPNAVSIKGLNVRVSIPREIHIGELPWMLYDTWIAVWLVPVLVRKLLRFNVLVSVLLTFCSGIAFHCGAAIKSPI